MLVERKKLKNPVVSTVLSVDSTKSCSWNLFLNLGAVKFEYWLWNYGV